MSRSYDCFAGDWSQNSGAEGSTGWANTESNGYRFFNGHAAYLRVTRASRRKRANEPAGGLFPVTGLPT